jgi:AmpD protein
MEGVRRADSPFFDARPARAVVNLVIIHNISLPPGEFGTGDVERLFTGKLDAGAHPFYSSLASARVSAHFFVDRQGAVIQFVSTADRAWHAGASAFEGRPGCNDYSVGIELEGTDFTPFAEPQYRTLGLLLARLCAVYRFRSLCRPSRAPERALHRRARHMHTRVVEFRRDVAYHRGH